MSPITEKMINFRVYNDGRDQLGVADVQLPSLDAITETTKGAGIAGEVEHPVLGHFGPMTLVLNWRTVTKEALILNEPRAHQFDLRGSIQRYNSATGMIESVGVKVVVKAMPKKGDPGKLATGTTDTTNEFECSYMHIFLDGASIVELDKYNFIYRVNGVDYLAKVRQDLGLI